MTGSAPDSRIEAAGRLTSFLTKAIDDLTSQGPKPMATMPPNNPSDPIKKNITGASFLGEKFKQDLAAAKAAVADAQTKIGNAVADVNATAVKAVEMAKAIQAEADDLKSSLGQGSNDV